MTPELIGIMALFGSIVALGVALFGALKWFADRVDRRFVELERRMDVRFEGVDRRFDSVDRRFDSVDRRFDSVDTRFEGVDRRFEGIDRRLERIEADLSKLKEGQARLEGMFEGAFERIPRTRPEASQEAVASSGAAG